MSSKFWLCVVKRSVKKGTMPPWWCVTTCEGRGVLCGRVGVRHAMARKPPTQMQRQGQGQGQRQRRQGSGSSTFKSGCRRKRLARAMCTIATDVSYTQPAHAARRMQVGRPREGRVCMCASWRQGVRERKKGGAGPWCFKSHAAHRVCSRSGAETRRPSLPGTPRSRGRTTRRGGKGFMPACG